MPKLCTTCNEERGTSKFTAGQWKLDDGVCRDCTNQAGTGESGSNAEIMSKGDEVILVGLSKAGMNGQVGILGDGPNANGCSW